MSSLPARVLLLGDIHGRMPDLVAAFQSAQRHGVTAVVQVGDNWLYQPAELVKIDRQARRYGVQQYWFLDGNHESPTALQSMFRVPRVHPLSKSASYLGRGARFTIGQRTALALGGAVSIDRFVSGYDSLGRPVRPRVEGLDWWADEAVSAQDRDRAAAGGPVEIMLTHDTTFEGASAIGFRLSVKGLHPVSAADDVESRRRLTEAVDAVSPQLLIHGHLHHRGSGTGRDGVRYEGLGFNGRPGSMAVLDAEDMSIADV